MIEFTDMILAIKRFIPGLTADGRLNLKHAAKGTRLKLENLPEEVQGLVPMFFEVGNIKGIKWPMGYDENNVLTYRYEWWEYDSAGRKRRRHSYELPTVNDLVA